MKKLYIIFLLLSFNYLILKAVDSSISAQELYKQFLVQDSLFILSEENNPQAALKTSMAQEQIANALHTDSLIMKAKFNKSSAMCILGFFDIALKELYAGLKLAEWETNFRYQRKYLQAIARVYQSMNDMENSNIHFEKAKKIAISHKMYADTISLNYEIGFNAIFLMDTERGLAIIKNNLAVAKKTNNLDAIFLGLDNLSNVTAEIGDHEKALNYELELLNYPEAWKTNYYKTGVYEHFAEIYAKLSRWEACQQYLDSTFKYANLIQSNDWLFECFKLQSMVFEAKGNYKEAFASHQKYLALKDSVYQKDYDVKMAAMATIYDLEAKQNQIQLLEKDNTLKQNQIIEIVLFGVLMIGILVAFFILKQQKEKQKLQLFFSQQLIQSQENEKKRIAQELHDSLGQNILFIKNQLQKNNTDNKLSLVLETVDNSLSEIRNIAKDLYPNQLEKYGLAAAVENLSEKVTQHADIFVSADIQQAEAHLSKQAQIHIYRIIQEAINNAIKHSQASALRITALTKGNVTEWLIQDNGKGFDKTMLAKKHQNTFGLLGMEERVKMLGGKWEIDSTLQQGTKLIFNLPNN